MITAGTLPDTPVESEVRFLEYRLEAIREWPPSPRKHATVEAISRRLAALAQSPLPHPSSHDLLTLSCRLLDDLSL